MDSLSGLRSFVAVVDAGGFSAAARALGRSKALLSKNVRDLEDELAARLLNRTTRKLSVTDTGREVYREAQRILAEVDALEDAVRDSAVSPRGMLRITAPRTLGEGPIAGAITDFLVAYPDIRAEIHLEDRFVDIVDEGFDVAIRITELADSSLIARRLMPFDIGVVCHPSVLSDVPTVDHPIDLARYPAIVDTNVKSRATWGFNVDGERTSITVTPRVEVNSPIAVRQAALAGLGVARVPLSVVADDISEGRLLRLLPEYELHDPGIYVIYPHRRHLTRRVRVFVDHMIEWAKNAESMSLR